MQAQSHRRGATREGEDLMVASTSYGATSSSIRRRSGSACSSTVKCLVSLCTVALLAAKVSAQALLEPANGKVMFGAWVQTEWETPAEFNERLGLNSTVIQISQTIPITPYDWVTGAGGRAPEELIERSGTDAAVFLTVYPLRGGLTNISADDYTILGAQIQNYTENYQRNVFLRFAPEFNGNWNEYGMQPVQFVQTWREMYTAIKAIVPQVAIVWAPNTGQGYPYGMTLPTNATEAAAVDTDDDGVLSTNDSPFAPWWPGPEFVDWVGLSVYWKGPNSRNINADVPDGYCHDAVLNINSNNGFAGPDPWYTTYCANATNIACMFAESAAAYHDMIDGDQGVPQTSMQRSWTQGCFFNRTFYEEFPRMKLMMQFEYKKNESDGGIQDSRDFRITNNTDVVANLREDVMSASDLFSWANYRPIPTSTPNVVTQTQVFTTTNAAGETVTSTSRITTSTFSFITVRNTQTSFPSLFGHIESSAVRAVVTSVALFTTACATLLGGTALLMKL